MKVTTEEVRNYILKTLDKLGMVKVERIIEVLKPGTTNDRLKIYRVIEGMQKKRIIVSKKDKKERKKKVIKLTTAGIKMIHEGADEAEIMRRFIRSRDEDEIIQTSEIYYELRGAGVKAEDIKLRKEALTALKQTPIENQIKILANINNKQYAIFYRDQREKEKIKKSITNIIQSTGIISGIIIVYDNESFLRRDMEDMLNTAITISELYLTTIEGIKEVVDYIKNNGIRSKVINHIMENYTGSEILKVTSPDIPIKYVWERNGTKKGIVDITNIKNIRDLNIMNKEHEEILGINGIIIFVDRKGEIWRAVKLLQDKEKPIYIVLNEPVFHNIYQYKENTIYKMKIKTKEEKGMANQ
ncbi:MAG: hypothetical protein ACPLVF_02115 [Thermovenabulum sp.]|uniref:hypothetical protein n=1 Tax=Thermovenabulum sp. TaxID=3100335 RepID=UPI003C7B8D8D